MKRHDRTPMATSHRRPNPQTRLVALEEAQLLLPKLSDEQLAVVARHGSTEAIRPGQVLARDGDPTYDLMVLLGGEVKAYDLYRGEEREIVRLRARDFIAELNLMTGQQVYVNCVVTRSGSIIRVPRSRVGALFDADQELGDLLLQTMFRRREAFLRIHAGIQIIGPTFSPDSQRLRSFAARNRLAYSFLDPDTDPSAREERRRENEVPVVRLGDVALTNPSNAELARAVGIAEEPNEGRRYDVVVVGAGPAGLAAAVYGASEGLSTAAVDAVAPGGQASTTSRIENYLGFPAGISGEEFGERALLQAIRFGAQLFVPRRAVGLRGAPGNYVVELDDGQALWCRSVILATGVCYRRLDVPGIARFEGSGVYYTPLDTPPGIGDEEPAVIVGGGNSAGQAAMALVRSGRRVYMVVRGPTLASTMSAYLLDRIGNEPAVTVLTRSVVSEVAGGRELRRVVVTELESGRRREIGTRCLFVMIGADPLTGWLPEAVQRDDHGYVLTGVEVRPRTERAPGGRAPSPFETSLPGLFAVGDVRANSIKRVASAAGEGSMALRMVQEFLAHLEELPGERSVIGDVDAPREERSWSLAAAPG